MALLGESHSTWGVWEESQCLCKGDEKSRWTLCSRLADPPRGTLCCPPLVVSWAVWSVPHSLMLSGHYLPPCSPSPHGSSLLVLFLLLLLNELVYFWLCWSLLQYTGLVGTTLVAVCGLHIATAFLMEKGVWALLLQSLGSVVVVHGLFSCPNLHLGSSWTRAWTHIPCTVTWILNHWTTRKVHSWWSKKKKKPFFWVTVSLWFLELMWGQFSSVELLSHVWLFATLGNVALQASPSITNSRSLLKLMSIELVKPSNHLVLCCLLLLLPSIFPSIRVFSNVQFFASGGQNIGVSASTSVFPMNI